MSERLPVVVIIGGGFGGLAAAKALGRSAAQIRLDRPYQSITIALFWRQTPPTVTSAATNFVLAQSNLRAWTYLTGQRGSRLIVNHGRSESSTKATEAHEILRMEK